MKKQSKAVKLGRPAKYPFDKIAKGKSSRMSGNRQNIQSAAYQAGLRMKKKFSCRTLVNGDTLVTRVK